MPINANFIAGSLVCFRGRFFVDLADNHWKMSPRKGPYIVINQMNPDTVCLKMDRPAHQLMFKASDLVPYVPDFAALPAAVLWAPDAIPIREIQEQRLQDLTPETGFCCVFEGYDNSQYEWLLLPRVATQPEVLRNWFDHIGWINAPRPVLALFNMLPKQIAALMNAGDVIPSADTNNDTNQSSDDNDTVPNTSVINLTRD
ncbi:hypothetical protein NMY22_g9855 [Coprinellus aureogranulatus]|nr:hypothetical protein NMY22_g9855 [Coprinellus aureogranulatus]